jgi:hypothetical protein
MVTGGSSPEVSNPCLHIADVLIQHQHPILPGRPSLPDSLKLDSGFPEARQPSSQLPTPAHTMPS